MKKIKLNIDGMHCSGCSTRLERVLNALNGVKNASVSLEDKQAIIIFNEKIVNYNVIEESIIDCGFKGEILYEESIN